MKEKSKRKPTKLSLSLSLTDTQKTKTKKKSKKILCLSLSLLSHDFISFSLPSLFLSLQIPSQYSNGVKPLFTARSPPFLSKLELPNQKPSPLSLFKTQLLEDSEAYGFRTTSTVSSSTTQQETAATSSVYVPTPRNRDLRTPHSGYHFDGTSRKFFEGWYLKVAIPERRQSFCFMYTVENPAFRKPLTALELVQNGPRSTGVGAQILGAYDKYICQYSEESQNFWGRIR